MKLKEYLERLNYIYKKYGDLDLCYSIDDECNSYRMVQFEAGVGDFIIEKDEFIFFEEDDNPNVDINCVCIN